MDKLRVGIIFGGRSGEHDVSLMSARSVVRHLDREKYALYYLGIDRSGKWYYGKDAEAMLRGEAMVSSSEALAPADLLPDPIRLSEVDVVIPVLHGPYGEDGVLQGLLELADMPYVGCGVLASAVSMDKALSKQLFIAEGLPVLPFRLLLRRQWAAELQTVVTEIEGAFSYPVFVKPANLGSSVGISKAHNQEELLAGLAEAARYDRRLLVEQGIQAREIEVSILGNEEPLVSLPGEVIPGKEWYDYETKYQDAGSRTVVPAPLTAVQTAKVQEFALRAYKVVDGSGLARVDFLVDRENGEIYLNEINTFPGFTSISMYPKLWLAGGLTYPELLDRLLALALDRHESKGQRS